MDNANQRIAELTIQSLKAEARDRVLTLERLGYDAAKPRARKLTRAIVVERRQLAAVREAIAMLLGMLRSAGSEVTR